MKKKPRPHAHRHILIAKALKPWFKFHGIDLSFMSILYVNVMIQLQGAFFIHIPTKYLKFAIKPAERKEGFERPDTNI